MRAYVPIARGYLMAAAIYYALISLSHPYYETGAAFAVLEGLSAVSALYAFASWFALGKGRLTGPGLELLVLGMNALFLGNTLAYQLLHFEPAKLVYFVLMAVVFATAAPSRRVAL